MNAKLLSAVTLGCFVIGLWGCEQEGPAEKAGKQIDQSIEKAGEKIEEAGDKIRESTNN